MIISTKQLLIGLAAVGIGWILAGEPTNMDQLKGGIDRLIGRNGPVGSSSSSSEGMMGIGPGGGGLPSLNYDHFGDGHHHHHHHHRKDRNGMPFNPMMMGGMGGMPPGGTDPNTQSQLQNMQQQMQQQQMQAQMQQQQQQFQDQLSQQQSQAQMQQMQQQLQQSQQQAAAAAAAAGQQPQTAQQQAATAATSAATQQQQATTTPSSQQMMPSQTAPGIVPQTSGIDPTTGMPIQQQQSPYGQNPYAIQSPYGGLTAAPPGVSPYSPMAAPVASYGTLGVPVGYGQPLGGTPMQNMFASSPNVLGNYQNVNVRGPVSYLPHSQSSYQHPQIQQQHVSSTPTYRSHLGIVDGDQIPHHRAPFFHSQSELMNMDLGNIYPGLHGIKVVDLIMSSPSKNADEVFPRGIDKYSYGGFEQDIHVYITRLLRHMEGFSPEEKVGILRDILLTYRESHPNDPTMLPDPFTLNPMSYFHHKKPTIRSGLPIAADQIVYKNDGGYMLPDKYAMLQMKETNSMPPMIHNRKGHHKNKKTLFFNGV